MCEYCVRGKNGKLIFEGDIVEHPYSSYYTGDTILKGVVCEHNGNFTGYIVKFNVDRRMQMFQLGYLKDLSKNDEYKIIGTIHDNPELLRDNNEKS